MLDIREEDALLVKEIERVSIAFEVERIFRLAWRQDGTPLLGETEHIVPYVKDYDREKDNRPMQWPRRFNLANWGLFTARDGTDLLGSVVIAFDTDGVDMLENRRDIAVIWDIRVKPDRRDQGIGRQLMQAAENWAIPKRCSELRVETQNINYAACRFYERRGFHLWKADSAAYPDNPNETQLIWSKALSRMGK